MRAAIAGSGPAGPEPAEGFDLAVRGGTLMSEAGRAELDAYVKGGQVALLSRRDDPHPADVVLDATDHYVLPGMVDTHVHLMEPGDGSREDAEHGTLAAACAGVTTIVEHTHHWPVTSPDRLREKRSLLEGRCYVDYGLAAHVFPGQTGELAALWRAGAAFFKVFTCSTHGVPATGPGLLYDLFDGLSPLAVRYLVHCEDESMTAEAERRLRAAARTEPGVVPTWRSLPAELVAVGTVACWPGSPRPW